MGRLALWALVPSVVLSYLVWAALGLCMAAILYEPIFAIVGKAIDHAGDRLRAIATITVFGGFAKSVFLPLTGVLVDGIGWRAAVGTLAAGLALTTLAVHRFAFATAARSRPAFALRATVGKQEVSPRQEVPPRQESPPRPTVAQGALAGKPGALIAVFTASSFAATARPYLVLVFYGQDRAGEMNGVFARPQQLARPVRRPDGGISA